MMKVSFNDIRRIDSEDTSPDTSFIGEYSSEPGPPDRTIDRIERGDELRNEYRYFIAARSGSVEQDYERMESLQAGQWSMIGLRAVIELHILLPSSNAILQKIESPGVWGIESDSDKSTLDEFFWDERNLLVFMLETMGIEVTDKPTGE